MSLERDRSCSDFRRSSNLATLSVRSSRREEFEGTAFLNQIILERNFPLRDAQAAHLQSIWPRWQCLPHRKGEFFFHKRSKGCQRWFAFIGGQQIVLSGIQPGHPRSLWQVKFMSKPDFDHYCLVWALITALVKGARENQNDKSRLDFSHICVPLLFKFGFFSFRNVLLHCSRLTDINR